MKSGVNRHSLLLRFAQTSGKISRMSIASILGLEGGIARRLPSYEARPQQLAMAEAVAQAIAEPHHLIVEAGTGVGKSFAYLVPAIQAAAASEDCTVVVSTHTISLQEQLIRKDIPFLQRSEERRVGKECRS